jgi:hypothetical protein
MGRNFFSEFNKTDDIASRLQTDKDKYLDKVAFKKFRSNNITGRYNRKPKELVNG